MAYATPELECGRCIVREHDRHEIHVRYVKHLLQHQWCPSVRLRLPMYLVGTLSVFSYEYYCRREVGGKLRLE